MKEWYIGKTRIAVEFGHRDDSDLGLVVKTKDIPMGVTTASFTGDGEAVGGLGVSIHEASSADRIEYWPSVSMKDSNRRELIYESAKSALALAENMGIQSVGFFTMGLEVGRVPSWEVAEEIIRAIDAYTQESSTVGKIVLVASSPTQLSSFQFVLENIELTRT